VLEAVAAFARKQALLFMENPSQSHGSSVTCHMGSYGITCYTTQVKPPRLNSAQTDIV